MRDISCSRILISTFLSIACSSLKDIDLNCRINLLRSQQLVSSDFLLGDVRLIIIHRNQPDSFTTRPAQQSSEVVVKTLPLPAGVWRKLLPGSQLNRTD